jgi:hypothetical protein
MAPAPPDVPAATTTRLVLLTLLVAGVFLGLMLASTDGHVVPQSVDLYLVCQYARSMGAGHPFRYNPGDPPSTGATSLLQVTLLGLGSFLGLRGEALVAAAIALGLACFVAAVLLGFRVGGLLAGPRAGTAAGLLIALGGPLAWGMLSGSDVALFAALALWTFDRMLAAARSGRLGALPLATVLLALTRPEGLLLAAAVAGWWTFPRRGGRAGGAAAWAGVAAGLGVLALNAALTGSWVPTSAQDKGLLTAYSPGDALAAATEYLVDVTRGLLLGFYPSQAPVGLARGWAPYYFTPLALVFVVVGAAGVRPPLRRATGVWLSVVVLAVMAAGPTLFAGVHFNRYLMWAFPLVHILTAAGVQGVAAHFARGSAVRERRLFRAVMAVAVALAAFSTLRFAAAYADAAGEVYRRDVAAARWIASALPPGVAMANQATSVEYLTGHRNLNLHGVTSPAFFGTRRPERDAGVLELLRRLPEDARPPYLITTSATQAASPLLRALAAGPPLFRTTSFGDEIEVYRTRYDGLGAGRQRLVPRSGEEGLAESDRLNVCDPRDEEGHDYAHRSRLGGLELHGAPRFAPLPESGTELADAGRYIAGFEDFRVRTVPGKDLVLVVRTAPSVAVNVHRAAGAAQYLLEVPSGEAAVTVDGRPAGRLLLQPRAEWEEVPLRIPASLVTRERTRIRLTGRYAAFHYWFLQ